MSTKAATLTLIILALVSLIPAGRSGAYTVQTMTFQDGVGGYNGTSDTWWGDGSAHGTEGSMWWDQADGNRMAVRFDNSIESLPSNAFILNASVTLTRTSAGGDTGVTGGGMAPVLATWNESDASVSISTNNSANLGGLSGTQAADTAAVFDCTTYARAWHAQANGITDLPQLVNNGLSFVDRGDYDGASDVGWYTREDATSSNRPLLSVTYIVPEGREEVVVAMKGVNGYAGAADVTLQPDPNDGRQYENYGGQSTFEITDRGFLWGRDRNSLIRFDNVGTLLPADYANWTLDKAWLGVTRRAASGRPESSTESDGEGNVTASWMTQEWLEGTGGGNYTGAAYLYYDNTGTPSPWPGGTAGRGGFGPNIAYAETAYQQLTSTSPNFEGTSIFDVTNTLTSVLYDGATNYGWNLTSDAFGNSYYNSKEASLSGWQLWGRPHLVMLISIPEPATGFLVLSAAALAVWRRS